MYNASLDEHVFVVAADEVQNGFTASPNFGDNPIALINYGFIFESTAPEAVLIDNYYDGFDIDNYGVIGEGGRALYAHGSHVNLNNFGEIYGDFFLLSSSIDIVNSGVIEGQIGVIEEFYGTPVRIENSGLISSEDTHSVISGTVFTRDIVRNSGEIEGDIYTYGGGDRVFNDAGTITGNVYLGDGRDIYRAVDGVVTGGVFGQNGHDDLIGGTYDDWLSGGAGEDVIDGGDGDDLLMGERHFDVLTGGAGNDVFKFERGYGGEYITDFENNVDTLLLDEGIWGGGLRAAQVLERFATTMDGVTQIDFGGRDVITLEGFDDYRLLANDIVFG